MKLKFFLKFIHECNKRYMFHLFTTSFKLFTSLRKSNPDSRIRGSKITWREGIFHPQDLISDV